MKRTILIMTALAGLLSGCQREPVYTEDDAVDHVIKFAPSIVMSGTSPTRSASSDVVREPEILLTDAATGIPLYYEVPANDESPVTTAVRGTLVNTGGADRKFSDFKDVIPQKFMVSAWSDETASTIPAYTEVLSRDTYWMTVRSDGKDKEYLWLKGSSMTFYAYANLPQSGAVITNPDASGQTLTYTVPASAAAQTDILLGYYTNTEYNKSEMVPVRFCHPLTAVSFRMGTIDNVSEFAVTSISIEGVSASGSVTQNAANADASSWNDDIAGTATVSQDISAQVETGSQIGGAFLLIPQTFNALSAARIKVACTIDGVSRTLVYPLSTKKPDGNHTAWKAGQSNVYTIGYNDAKYIFDVTDGDILFADSLSEQQAGFHIRSYKYNGLTDVVGARTPLAFDAWYSIDGKANDDPDKTWIPFPAVPSDVTAAGISGLKAEGNDGSAAESGTEYTLTAAARTTGTPVPVKRWTSDETVADNWDLSKMPAGGEGNGSSARNTANCYIVKHPGTYRFPCVYGNAVRNGQTYTQAYHTDVSGTGVLGTFVNSMGRPIGTPYVLQDIRNQMGGFDASKVGAALLWCDAKSGSDLMVGNVSLNYTSGSETSAEISFSTLGGNSLVPSNAVIALYYDNNGIPGLQYMKSSSDTNTDLILWSWHIWISDEDLSWANAPSVNRYGTHSFLPTVLGWCDGEGTIAYKAPAAHTDIRLKQKEGNLVKYLSVSQSDVLIRDGSNPHYQWGRKDPFPGCKSIMVSEQYPFYWGDGTSAAVVCKGAGNPLVIPLNPNVVPLTIANPTMFCTNGRMDQTYINLWSTNLNVTGPEATSALNVDKTVYDPCPYGYKVSQMQPFQNFTIDGGSQPLSGVLGIFDYDRHSYIFKNSSGELDQRLTFPVSGQRSEYGELRYVGQSGHYHCAALQFNITGNGQDFWYQNPDNPVWGTDMVLPTGGNSRGRGLSVRPVTDTQ